MHGFSYSGIKTFEQCPKKYYHTRVARDVQDDPGEAALYGTAVHKAAEDYVTNDTPIPPKFKHIEPVVQVLDKFPGDHYAELKLGLKREGGLFVSCDFDDPEFWWHGIGDRVIVHKHRALSFDFKTGKNARYADIRQLDLIAGGVFAQFPHVMHIKSALLYVDTNDFIPKEHVRTEMSRYLGVFDEPLRRREAAYESGVWNPKASGLCPWCPVQTCEHWSPRRK